MPLIVKKYGDSYKVTICKNDVWSERQGNAKKEKNEKNEKNDNKLDNNISRAKGKVLEYAKCNDWDYFFTGTLDKKKQDRFDLQGYISDLGRFIRNERIRTGAEIRYILIPERHKNGAWHVHGYFYGIPSADIKKNEYGYFDWLRYSKRFGYCSLDKIKDKDKCDNYITKYISKDMGGQVIEKNKKLYYCSRGLNTAEIMHESYISEKLYSPDFENDFVQIKWCKTFSEVETLLNIIEN